MKQLKRRPYLVLPVVAALLVGGYRLTQWNAPTESSTIRISGNIEVTTVQLSFKVPGWIEARTVSEGERVQSGDMVARVDHRELEHEVAMRQSEAAVLTARVAELEAGSRPEERERARAATEMAEARLNELLAGSRSQEVRGAYAAVQRAEAEQRRAAADYDRLQRLYEQNVISTRDRDTTLAAYRSTQAGLTEAQERLRLVEEGPRQEQIAQAQAALAEAQAYYEQVTSGPRTETIDQARAEKARAEEALRLSETRLSYAAITAPLSGMVLSEHVEVGEYVSPGAPIVTVADLETVWLRGYINQTDLGRVQWGQKVRVTTDSYPDKVYEGIVSFISSEAEFTPKSVQTDRERVKLVYRIKVDIANPDFELKPGMPADGVIHLTPKGDA